MGPLLLRLHRIMPKPKTSKKAGAAPPAPYDPPKKEKEPKGPIWEKKPRNFSIGGDIQPKRDLSRFVKWPKYVRLQRQRKVLMTRLKVPPSVAQFSQTLEKSLAINLFKLLNKYKAEDKEAKKERLQALALLRVAARRLMLARSLSSSNTVSTMSPSWLSRRRLSWLSSPTMWTPLSWLCGCPRCAARWKLHTASSSARAVWEPSAARRTPPALPSHPSATRIAMTSASW